MNHFYCDNIYSHPLVTYHVDMHPDPEVGVKGDELSNMHTTQIVGSSMAWDSHTIREII